MNSRKWKPNRPYTPSASVGSGTFQLDRDQPDSGKPIRLPTSSPSPVSKNGGRCCKDTPKGARVPHRAMAPSASSVGAPGRYERWVALAGSAAAGVRLMSAAGRSMVFATG